MKKRVFSLIFFFLAVFLHPLAAFADTGPQAAQSNKQSGLTTDETRAIEAWVESNMKDGEIPGMSVVIVQNNTTIYNKGFGYANLETKSPVTPETLFELGSTSKAFTALGILQLEEEGRINLSAPVQEYLPWFEMKYVGEHKDQKIDSYVAITLKQLLYHTSGIPPNSLGDIPVADGADALEKTVRTQVGKVLDFYPGEHFEYSSMNYDILGLVIQQVSGMPFEEYIKQNILAPLALNNTYISREGAPVGSIAQGYKLGFFSPQAYTAPIYKGNDPAAYVIMNAQDLARWLQIQLGYNLPDAAYGKLIAESHIPNYAVSPDVDGSSYAAGWRVYQTNGEEEYSHGGSNPNYSSHFLFLPADKLAIGVLTNIDSSYTDATAEGIMDILQKNAMPAPVDDIYKDIDRLSSITFILSLLLCGITLFFSISVIVDFCKRRRRFSSFRLSNSLGIILSTLFLCLVAYCLYLIPDVAFSNLPWNVVFVWAPSSFIPAVALLLLAITTFCVYCQTIFCFPKNNEKIIYPLLLISFASGFGNSIIIFSVNSAISGLSTLYGSAPSLSALHVGLVFYFVLGVSLYVLGQKLVRSKLIVITNEFVYQKRAFIIERLLSSSLDEFESIGEGKIQACLNNDTEVISYAPNMLIGMLTDTVTLICCFIYLSVINIYGFLISLAVILVAASLYYIAGRSANKLLEQSRDIQNAFFDFVNDFIGGFKDLSLNSLKREEFKEDMLKSSYEFKVKRTRSAVKFLNAGIVGDLLFTLVIGSVAFLFPYIFVGIREQTLTAYIFVFLYMTVPVNGVLRAIPQLFQIRVSWKRVNDLITCITQMTSKKPAYVLSPGLEQNTTLEIKDLEYEYSSEDNTFKLGPINLKICLNEILFITGGNGSGKTTFAKMLTGLYKPQKGRILLNGNEVGADKLGEYYSHVFSDFYLFRKLYGIDYDKKRNEIKDTLEVLQMQDKVQVNQGEFSTLKLSTGQRKRLALLVSYLEDKQIFIFDEWAADQDPDFRRYFYQEFLYDLKEKGKCVIVITHDDRYFDLADTVVKMETGKIEHIMKADRS